MYYAAMNILDRFREKEPILCSICEWGIVVLLVLSIVWRGGKSIDMTWLLTGMSMVAMLVSYLHGHNADDENDQIPLVIWLPVLGYILLTALSYMVGIDEVLRTASLGFAFLWIIRKIGSKVQDHHFSMRILRVIGFSAVGSCLIGILVYVFQPVNRFVGTFFDYRFQTDYWPNAWAQFLILAWPIVLFLALKDFTYDQKKSVSRIAFLLRCSVVGFVLGCLFLSYSRGAILVFIAQLLVWTAIVFHKSRPNFPLQKVVPVTFIVAVVAFVTFTGVNTFRSGIYDVQDVGAKVTFTASEGVSSIDERLDFWKQSFVLGTKKPLLGWGPYSFRFVQPSMQRGVLATSDHPHNVLLKLFMERGIFTVALFIVLIGFVLHGTLSHLLAKSTEIESLQFSLRTFLFLSVGGVLLHNMIDYNLQFVGIALPFWLFVGMLVTYLQTTSHRQAPFRIAQTTEVVLSIAILTFALYEGGYLVVSSLGRQAEADGNTEQALLWYSRASGEFFTRDMHLSKAKISVAAGDLESAQSALDTYMKENMQDYRAWKRLGEVALLTKKKENALSAYTKAFSKGKYNDLGVVRGLLEARMATDGKEGVEEMLGEVDPLLRSFADAIQVNAHFIALSSNVEELIYISNMLSRLFPDQAPRYQVMAAKADHHAQIERARIESRPPGFLW